MLRVLKWAALVFAALFLLAVVGCSTIALPRVTATPEGATPTPDLLAPIGGMARVETVENWEAERAPFWTNMQLSQVFGSIPPELPVSVRSDETLRNDLFDGKASLRAVTLEFGQQTPALTIDVHFVIPNTDGPHPIVLGSGFCPNHTALPFDGVEPPQTDYPGFCDGSWADGLFKFIFGRYITTPPLEHLIDHGFAFGAYYPGQIVPDSSRRAADALAALPGGEMTHGPYATIGAWAWAASEINTFLDADPAFDPDGVILFGHSRYGKSSLLAGALDRRIDGVIAHQSGTGGASLQKNGIGEPIESISDTYPHWFTETYALYIDRVEDMPFDQHALVALMAPRPLLLGNSARDKWSDPKGAFDAARAAGAVYELYGSDAFDARNLKDFQPASDLAYQFREGTHGITPEDWAPFLDWLDAHFGESDR